MMEERPLQNGKSLVGHLRSAVYSPHFKKVVGIAMIKKEYWDNILIYFFNPKRFFVFG